MDTKLNIKNEFWLIIFASSIIIIGIIVVFAPKLPVNAAEPDQSVVNDLNKQIDAQRAKIDALTAQITEYQE